MTAPAPAKPADHPLSVESLSRVKLPHLFPGGDLVSRTARHFAAGAVETTLPETDWFTEMTNKAFKISDGLEGCTMRVPSTIASLWDMLKFNADKSLKALMVLSGAHADWQLRLNWIAEKGIPPRPASYEISQIVVASIHEVRDTAEMYEMKASKENADSALAVIEPMFAARETLGVRRINHLLQALYSLTETFLIEAKIRRFFVLSPHHECFYAGADASFGREVEDAFPDAIFDIDEAGKCRALARWTACVLHLMRALEPAIRALQAEVGVTVPKENWHQILDQIEAKILQIKKQTHGGDNEQWFAEAAQHFRHIKNAWRNHAAHGRESYDQEKAVVIYEGTRAFMRHLATRLSQNSQPHRPET